MNVKGPGQPPSPGTSGPEAENKLDRADRSGGSQRSGEAAGEPGKSFAERVSGPRTVDVPGVVAGPRAGDVVVGDLAADLRAGKLTSRAAVDKILERIVARQVGPEAPAVVRDQLRAALQDAIETDPLLADKLRKLG
jgi:hypothetical protein